MPYKNVVAPNTHHPAFTSQQNVAVPDFQKLIDPYLLEEVPKATQIKNYYASTEPPPTTRDRTSVVPNNISVYIYGAGPETS